MKIIFKTKNSFLCTPIDIQNENYFFCFASCGFSEKCYLVVVWCWAWDAGLVRPPRLVSYACLYTTSAEISFYQTFGDCKNFVLMFATNT